jgi:signal transduction histidine kinase
MLMTLRARGDELPAGTRSQLEEVAWQEADRLRRLIEQLLDLSRLDARSIPIELEPLVLQQLLAEIVSMGDRGGDDVLLDVDPTIAVVADALVIERVVTNVVSNARRHGKPPIRVTAEQRDRYVRITVEDQGPGVAEELVPRLFERFERGGEGGTGLGLAIARAYANAHGGDLVYHPGGRGARFELILPR